MSTFLHLIVILTGFELEELAKLEEMDEVEERGEIEDKRDSTLNRSIESYFFAHFEMI
jgi:hypothetical protein